MWPATKKYVLPHAKTAALGMTEDFIEGKNLRDSFRNRGADAIKSATQQLRDQSGSGHQKRNKQKRALKRKKPYSLELKSPPCQKRKKL